MSNSTHKEYLGDAVYAEFENQRLRLTTSNGYQTTNEIYLEAEIYTALEAYVRRIKRENEENNNV